MTGSVSGVPGKGMGPSPRRLSRRWVFILGVCLVIQLAILYFPQGVGGPQVPGLDKVVHLSIFAAPAMAALTAGLPARWVLAVLAVHAPVSELIQHLWLSQRRGDVVDVVADLCGIALGGLAYLVWSRRKP